MKKPILILTVLILIIGALFITRTIISNKISTSGVALGKTQSELAYYRTQNFLLREKINELSSLSHISPSAEKLGFVKSQTSFTLTKSLPLARAQ